MRDRRKQQTAFIGLGGNIGDVLGTFRGALARMVEVGMDVTAVSKAYRTEALVPWCCNEPVSDYWNAACCVQTTLAPARLLEALLQVEWQFGRVRSRKWAPRTLDLDLLLYGHRCVQAPELTVPHPGLQTRLFVLRPLVDIAAAQIVPGSGMSVAEILAQHTDPNAGIKKIVPDWTESQTNAAPLGLAGRRFASSGV